jgi:hypothetical protein
LVACLAPPFDRKIVEAGFGEMMRDRLGFWRCAFAQDFGCPGMQSLAAALEQAVWTCLGKVESSSEGKRSISWASRSDGSGRNLRPKPFGWLR